MCYESIGAHAAMLGRYYRSQSTSPWFVLGLRLGTRWMASTNSGRDETARNSLISRSFVLDILSIV